MGVTRAEPHLKQTNTIQILEEVKTITTYRQNFDFGFFVVSDRVDHGASFPTVFKFRTALQPHKKCMQKKLGFKEDRIDLA